jgi:hypothetical protein
MIRRAVFAVALFALPAAVAAQARVNQTRPAPPDGVVQIENAAGSVRVIGWDRAEVAVSGTLGPGAEGVSLRGDKRYTHVEVETEDNPHGVHSDLEVRVPAGSDVSIESFGAAIEVSGVLGQVSAETVNADVRVTGAARKVRAESVNGGVSVSGASGHVQAESVNGAVSVRGGAGEVDASTVNGPLIVSGSSFSRATLETVNGTLTFDGGLGAGGSLDASTVSGDVELVLPATTAADFSVSTFSGEVRNELGPAARRASRYTTEKDLTFSIGGGGANVSVETLSGSITIRRK